MSARTIHHVTAVTSQIARNKDFYTNVLGLRLVKKSVNQDDVSAYHLFYADKVGTPGTDMTFFDWPMIGANNPGAGTISLTSFRVPGTALEWWEARLEAAGCMPETDQDELGRSRILFSDPEGQQLELVDDTDIQGGSEHPWGGVVAPERALRGIIGVDLTSGRPDATVQVLTQILGYKYVEGSDGSFEAGDADHYAHVRVHVPDARRMGRVGAGGVHHVAFRVKDDEELLEMQAKVESLGIGTSGYIDRFYFHSLYFREPGGILFELATDGPGFASDESVETLGEQLALPPFLEGRRTEIEAGLKPLTV